MSLGVHRIRMRRRSFIGAAAVAAVAGCVGASNVEGDVVVDETVRGQTQVFNFDAESGDTINVHVENEAGFVAWVTLESPDGSFLLDNEEVETAESFTVETGHSGVHRVSLGPDERASVEVAIG